MESWRTVWRDGFVPGLPTDGLQSLAAALRADDRRLIQGASTTPPSIMQVEDWPVEGCDAICWCGWCGDAFVTVGQVGEFFARMCFEVDQRLGEAAACRYYLCWYDDTPRDEMIRELLPEVELALAGRAAA